MTSEELGQLPLADRVVYVRKTLMKLSQVGFGRRIGVSERTVKRWEAGFIAPTRSNAERIAAESGLEPGLFYPDESVDLEPDPLVAELAAINERLAKMDDQLDGQIAQQNGLLAELGKTQASLTETAEELAGVAEALRQEIDELRKQAASRRPA